MSRLMMGLCAALLLGAAAGAQAETLNLECRVKERIAGRPPREFLRRLDIDLATKKVRFYDNRGHGWELRNQYEFLSADAARIKLEDRDGKQSYVDRLTGEYAFRNLRERIEARGACRKVEPEKPKF